MAKVAWAFKAVGPASVPCELLAYNAESLVSLEEWGSNMPPVKKVIPAAWRDSIDYQPRSKIIKFLDLGRQQPSLQTR